MCTPDFVSAMAAGLRQSGLAPVVSPNFNTPALIQPSAHPTYDPNYKPTPISVPKVGGGIPTDPNASVNVTWAPYNPNTGVSMAYGGQPIGAAQLPNQGQGWKGTETVGDLYNQWSFAGPPPGSASAPAAAAPDLGPFATDQQLDRRNNAAGALNPYYWDVYSGGGSGSGGA